MIHTTYAMQWDILVNARELVGVAEKYDEPKEAEEWSDEEIEDLFAYIDADDNGFISSHELQHMYGDQNGADKMVAVDINEDGMANFDEMRTHLTGGGE